MSKKILTYGLALLCLHISYAQKEIEGLSVNKKGIQKSYIKDLRKKIEADGLKNITSVVVLREGKLSVEEYYSGADRSTLHDTRSLTKSFAGTLAGIAIDEGYILSKQSTLADFYELKKYKNYSARKAEVTIENLLKMDSGFDGFDFDPSSPGNEENMYPTPDWVKFALDVPMKDFDEDEMRWQYFTAGVVILGDILNQKTPDGLKVYAKEKLFNPLGIEKVKWQYTPSRVPNTAGSCRLNSLSFAKYGQLYKNKGVWNGKQVVPEKWVEESMTVHYDLRSDGLSYGYLLWQKIYEYNDKEYEVFCASGNGGSKVFVFTELDLVVVVTSTAYNQSYMHRQADTIVEDYILPAVLDEK
ncbi:MAG: serine hydrolase domain-containing protein [Ekhidna sp.]